MRSNALLQLNPLQFDIHFPESCRQRQIEFLQATTNLLDPNPVSDLTKPELAEMVAETEILITGWFSKAITADVRKLMPRLKLVAHLAGTVKMVLPDQAATTGLRVVNAVEENARPVAEFTLAHILMHMKRVEDWRRLYRAERGNISTRTTKLTGALGNTGRKVGIVGASRVGKLVIEYVQRHRMQVLLHDPFVTKEAAAAMGAKLVSMDQLLSESDVVSLHQPLLPTTDQSFGAREFALMRDGALLINTARGRIVQAKALEQAMADGRLYAILDVTDPDPLNSDSPLWDMPNVQLTPHVAGSFGCEVCDMTDAVLQDIGRFCRGEKLLNEVSLLDWEKVA